MSRKNPSAARRSGFTLIEMLVVIVVVLTVSGLAIAIAAPDNEARRLRETARQVSGMLQSARAKAIQIGRPVGVMIEPDGPDWLRATSMQFVEVAPPYGGDFADSKALIEPISLTQADVYLGARLDRSVTPPRFMAADQMWVNLLQVNDLIRFNHQGHYYKIVDINSSNVGDPNQWALRIEVLNSSLPNYGFYPLHLFPPNTFFPPPAPNPSLSPTEEQAWRNTWMPVPYEVVRQPETSAGTPLEIPDGVVLDLSLSGVGKAGAFPMPPIFPSGPGPIVLLFSPKGQVAIWMPGDPTGQYRQQSIPFDAIFLMIGNNESIGAISAGADSNLANPNAYWVTVHHQTGLVTSSDNVPVNSANPGDISQIAAARGKSIQSESTTTN